MTIPEESAERKQTRKERLEDGRVALVRIRHRLQRIQDEMEQLNQSRRQPRADNGDR